MLHDKIQTVGVLLNVNATIYFKFKPQLKFINNKNYSSINENFHSGLRWKYINLKVKNWKNKTRRGPFNGTLSILCCLNTLCSVPLKSFPSDFLNRFILDPFCSNTLIIVVLFFQIVWIDDTKFLHASAVFSIFCLLYYYNFSSTLRTFPVFVTVATLPLYHSPVNCRSRNVEGNFKYKTNYRYNCHFPGLKFIQLNERYEGLPS